jgi:hypothetical protein
MIVLGQFNLLFRPGLRTDFLDEIMGYDPEFDQFLRQSTMDGPEIAATIMVGMPRLFEIGDGEPVPYDIPKIGPKVMGVDKEFGLGFALTRRTIEDDQYGKANQSAKWLGHAVNMTKEFRSAQFLDDAYTGTTFKGIDNLALFSTAHTLINSSSTVSNTPSVPVGMSVAGITTLTNLAQLCKDENGDPHKVTPDTIVYGNDAATHQKVMQIFGSELEPYTSDNQENAIKKRYPNIKRVMSHYRASATNYEMFDSKQNDCHFVTRRAPLFEDDWDFNSKAALYSVSTRFLIWFVSWRAWYGMQA